MKGCQEPGADMNGAERLLLGLSLIIPGNSLPSSSGCPQQGRSRFCLLSKRPSLASESRDGLKPQSPFKLRRGGRSQSCWQPGKGRWRNLSEGDSSLGGVLVGEKLLSPGDGLCVGNRASAGMLSCLWVTLTSSQARSHMCFCRYSGQQKPDARRPPTPALGRRQSRSPVDPALPSTHMALLNPSLASPPSLPCVECHTQGMENIPDLETASPTC